MSIDRTTVSNLAHLACIDVDDNRDSVSIQADLTRIMHLVEQLLAVSTDNITPLYNPHEDSMLLREDMVAETIDRERLQQGALVQEGWYLVPQVVE